MPDETTPILTGNEIIVTGLTFYLNQNGEIQSRTRGFWERLWWSLVFFFIQNALSDRYRTFWSEIKPTEEQPVPTLDFTEVASTYTSNQIKTLLQSMPKNNQQLKLKVPHYDGQAYNCLDTDTQNIQKALFSAIQANSSLRKQLVIPFETTDHGRNYFYINRDMWFLSWRKKAICRQMVEMVESAGYTWHDSHQEGMQPCTDQGRPDVFRNGTDIYIQPAGGQERRGNDMETQLQVLLALGAITVIGATFAWRFGGGENHTRANLPTEPQEDQGEDESKDGRLEPLPAEQVTPQAAGALANQVAADPDEPQPHEQDRGALVFFWRGMGSIGREIGLGSLSRFFGNTSQARQPETSWDQERLRLLDRIIEERNLNKQKKKELLEQYIKANCKNLLERYMFRGDHGFFNENATPVRRMALIKSAFYYYANKYEQNHPITEQRTPAEQEKITIQNWTYLYHVMAQINSCTDDFPVTSAILLMSNRDQLEMPKMKHYLLEAHSDRSVQYKSLTEALDEIAEEFGYRELKLTPQDLKTKIIGALPESRKETLEGMKTNGETYLVGTDEIEGQLKLSKEQGLNSWWLFMASMILVEDGYSRWRKEEGYDRTSWEKLISDATSEYCENLPEDLKVRHEGAHEGGGGGAGMASGLKLIGF